MKWQRDEIFFDTRKELLTLLPWLQGITNEHPELGVFTVHQCARCGCWFASPDPSTDTGAIICGECDRVVIKDYE